jgi:trimeric autotransporter adhesin
VYDEEDRTKLMSPEVQYEAVNYLGLIPVLVSSVQELKNENDELKNENDELKKELADLKTLVNKLAALQNINTTTTGGTLLQNTPNPVRGSTIIRYSLPEGATRAHLLVTDALGRTINTVQLTTSGQVNMDVSTLSAGVYNYSLVVEGRILQTKKMTVEK